MISAAETQLGNIGGKPYWSWYGFASRVEWCACFVSWCAEQCGFLESGVLPMFSSCEAGIAWFKNRERWRDRGYTPAPGDLIFFDWEGDGISDHVGIVEKTDSVARRSYTADSVKIMGYGLPDYNMR
jgi:cell wall-associated NlpC family hydrolase